MAQTLAQALDQATRWAKAGALEDAVRGYRALMQQYGPRADVLTNLGLTLHKLGRHDEAVHALRNALHLQPDLIEACLNLGLVLLAQRRFEEAGQAFAQALQLNPGHPGAHDGLGLVAQHQGYLLRARGHFEDALQRDPQHLQSLVNLAGNLHEGMQTEAGLAILERLMDQPDGRKHASNYLMTLQYSDRHDAAQLHQKACELMAHMGQDTEFKAPDMTAASGLPASLAEPLPRRPGRLRVGLVSADLRAHPVGWFLKGVLPRLAQHLSLIAFANQYEHDPVTQELKAAVERWICIAGYSDEQVLQIIRGQQVDVLIDLSGHTAGHRLQVFARRAAPVQLSWLGYFATTGLTQMDYILLDSEHAPPGSHQYFSEKVAWIEPIRMCFSPPTYAPAVQPPPCLDNGLITFGSFNNTGKITPTTIALWAAVLRAVPESRLHLKWKNLIEPALKKDLRQQFARQGVSPSRLILFGASSHPAMLEEYGDIDIALDTFPFSGGTTTCEALWMGVPVVTLRGDRPVARQSAAMLRAIGLAELAADDSDSFVEICKRLASDREQLSDMRQHMRTRMQDSSLFDPDKFTQAFLRCLHGLVAADA
jgi:protein O-GlcNAc transferase